MARVDTRVERNDLGDHDGQGHFLVTYLKDACHEVRLFDTSGKNRGTIRLAGLGTVAALKANANRRDVLFIHQLHYATHGVSL